jgi:imidazolonepropionase-like amidohydrolase
VNGSLLFTAARLFDGEHETATPDVAVLVHDGVVRRIGPQSAEWPSDVERVSFGQATILPGLIDAHAHLCFDGSAEPIAHLAALDDDGAIDVMERSAMHALGAGVTTLRDLGSRGDTIFRLRQRWVSAGDRRPVPTLLAAGRPMTIPDGHCWFLGGVTHGEADLLATVRQEVDRGADVIKIMATGGAMTASSDPGRPQFPADTLRRAVDQVHQLGRPVASHAHSTRGIHEAVAAGVQTVEHATFLTDRGSELTDADIALVLASDVVLVPTLAPIRRAFELNTPSRLGQERGISPEAFLEQRYSAVRRAHAAGIRQIAGSDCGVDQVSHDSVLLEIEELHTAGLSRVEALRAATGWSADALGVADRAGRVAPDLPADLLIVDGDPFDDLGALRRPVAVYKAGMLV